MNTSHAFYDELRATDPENFIPVIGGNDHIGRNLHRYNGTASGAGAVAAGAAGTHGEDSSIVMCHLPQFMRYTAMNGDGHQDLSEICYGASAGAIMAINHWNNGNGAVVKDIEGINQRCKIRFTTEIFNTQALAMPAVKGLTDMITRSPTSIVEPQPCAVLGTIRSSVAVKFATVTGVYDLLQVSQEATSDALDNKVLYPLFSRTHTSDAGSARLLPKFMNDVMDIQKFAVVYLADDGYGTSYLKVVQNYARENGLYVLPVPLTLYPTYTREGLMEELKVLLDSKLNYVIGVIFDSEYAEIMEAARELGVAGPGKMWLFCGAMVSYLYDNAQTFEKHSLLATASYGNAVITDGGDGVPGVPEYDMFVQEWEKLGNNPDTLSYINSKQPPPPEGESFDFNRTKDWFYKTPNHVALYTYDAVIGMGISACQAAIDAKSTFEEGDVFTGAEHHSAFIGIDFRSASGDVKIGPDNFSRNDESTNFFVGNIVETSATDTTVTLQGKGYALFDAATAGWEPYMGSVGGSSFTDQFIFSDGTKNAPPEIGGVEEERNLISTGVRSACLILASVIILTAIACVAYLVRMRKHAVIRMSQPPFLVMICVGTIIMALAIIPVSMDEGVVGQRSLDASCSLSPWLFSIGFVVTFSALFSKLWRVNKIVDASRSFRRVTVTMGDVMVPFAVLLASNAVILSIWAGVAPRNWERTVLERNQFDQVIVSEGACASDRTLGFSIAIIVVNGTALLLACYQAYIGREVRTEMNESKYIGMAMICIFQSFFFGVPLLFITRNNSSAFSFVVTSICFVICVATLLFIFVPKILAQRTADKARSINRGRSNVSGLSTRALQLRGSGSGNIPPSAASNESAGGSSMGDRLVQLRADQRLARRQASQESVGTSNNETLNEPKRTIATQTVSEDFLSDQIPLRNSEEDLGHYEPGRRVQFKDVAKEKIVVMESTRSESDVEQGSGSHVQSPLEIFP